jgi:hypothetical protein
MLTDNLYFFDTFKYDSDSSTSSAARKPTNSESRHSDWKMSVNPDHLTIQ